jgi:CBS domain-containing protein
MNIREVMTPNPKYVSPADSIQNAARIMRDNDTGAVPVVDNGRPIGIVTDRDIVVRAVAEDGQLNRPIRDIVSGSVVCVTPDMSTHEAADLMSEHQIRRLPVVENDRLVGIVSLGDLAVKEAKDKRVGRRRLGDHRRLGRRGRRRRGRRRRGRRGFKRPPET